MMHQAVCWSHLELRKLKLRSIRDFNSMALIEQASKAVARSLCSPLAHNSVPFRNICQTQRLLIFVATRSHPISFGSVIVTANLPPKPSGGFKTSTKIQLNSLTTTVGGEQANSNFRSSPGRESSRAISEGASSAVNMRHRSCRATLSSVGLRYSSVNVSRYHRISPNPRAGFGCEIRN